MPEKDPKLDKEKAEGSRRTIDEAIANEAKRRRAAEEAGRQPGITNRSLEEEDEQQAQLPPRGHAKREE